jgi:hypothetical protein
MPTEMVSGLRRFVAKHISSASELILTGHWNSIIVNVLILRLVENGNVWIRTID